MPKDTYFTRPTSATAATRLTSPRITALLLWLLPGGTLWALLYLIFQEIKFDQQASAWSEASFAEYMERQRAQKEAKDDTHPVRNQ